MCKVICAFLRGMFAITAFGYLFGFVGLLIVVLLAAATGVVVRFARREFING